MSTLSPLVLGALALIVTAVPVAAQDPATVRPRPVGSVYVRSIDGAESQGQLLRLGPETLTILEAGVSHDIPLANITRLQVRGDSVKNGAVIGAVVLGAWCALICPQGLDGYSSQLPYILGVNIALGAAVGAGIDAMHVGRTTIYQSPADVASRGLFGRKVNLALGFRF